MQTTITRHRFYLFCYKISISILLSFTFCYAPAQSGARIPNMIDHDQKKYYFGLSFGFNTSSYRITKSDYFSNNDTVLSINPLKKPGFSVGILGALKLNDYFYLRFIPTIILADKSIRVSVNKFGLAPNTTTDFKTESILFHLPLQLKLNSDRQDNFRFYAFTGVKYDWDMSSNARSRKGDELFRVNISDFGYEIGAGMEFYFSNFILSPEIKVSRGIQNIQKPDDATSVSRAMDAIRTSMVMFTIHLEG